MYQRVAVLLQQQLTIKRGLLGRLRARAVWPHGRLWASAPPTRLARLADLFMLDVVDVVASAGA